MKNHQDKPSSSRASSNFKHGPVIRLLLALILGTATGMILGPRAHGFGAVGTIIIKCLKALAVPLVFFAITDAFCRTSISLKKGAEFFAVSFINACVALIIALSLSHLFNIGKQTDVHLLRNIMSPTATAAATVTPTLAQLSDRATNFILGPLLRLEVVHVIIVALFLGLLIKLLSKTKLVSAQAIQSKVAPFFKKGFEVISRILEFIILLIPLAVFCIIAQLVGASGFHIFIVLGYFVVLVLAGMLVQVFIYYPLLLQYIARVSPKRFFVLGAESFITALGTGSSLATLPVTLPTLKDKMHVSDSSARMAAVIGTNFNHVGILLYEVVAALFIAQIQGLSLSLVQQTKIALTSVVAAVGIAGIPDAGFITLSLVLSAGGLSLAGAPFLFPADWLIGRWRATVNVITDMTVAVLLDRHHR